MSDEIMNNNKAGAKISSGKTALADVVSINYLTKNNAIIEQKGAFLSMKATLVNDDGAEEEKSCDRIFLHRNFPYDTPFEYISVLDRDSKEIGLIRSLDDFDEITKALLSEELACKYYTPGIRTIISVKERYGFSYWQVMTDASTEELSFTVKDTYSSIYRVNYSHLIITDINGNRYDIPDVEALDPMSFRKIELYL